MADIYRIWLCSSAVIVVPLFQLCLHQNNRRLTHSLLKSYFESNHNDRRYLSSVLDVTMIRDVINPDTGQRRTVQNWAEWLVDKEGKLKGVDPPIDEVWADANKMAKYAEEVPNSIIADVVAESGIHIPKHAEIVGLTKSSYEEQDEEEKVSYAYVRHDTLEEVILDALHIPHRTGDEIDADEWTIQKLEFWRGKNHERIRGCWRTTFPKNKGWILNNEEVELDKLTCTKMTRALTSRAFKSPASESSWPLRLGEDEEGLDFRKVWGYKSFFATGPRPLQKTHQPTRHGR